MSPGVMPEILIPRKFKSRANFGSLNLFEKSAFRLTGSFTNPCLSRHFGDSGHEHSDVLH